MRLMPKITSINLVALITIPFSIWLGFSGRVDWWLIGLIWLMGLELNLKLKR